MSFEIRVTEKTVVEVPRQSWEILGKDELGNEKRGWTPVADVPKREEKSVERLFQVVDGLDLAAVIKAVNRL